MPYEVTLIPGDGIGPEVTGAARRVLAAASVAIRWDEQPAGAAVMAREGTPLPARVLDSIRRTRVALKGPITTPVGSGFRSVNVALRTALDLYAAVRPAKSYPGVPARFGHVDIVVIRENTEDVYAGIEFAHDAPETAELLSWLAAHSAARPAADTGISIKLISRHGSERIIRYAFDYARRHGRRRVVAVHKANIMKSSDGLFLEVARQLAPAYPEIGFADMIVDNLCAQLVQRPEAFDVLVLPNLYGDIVSDLTAGLVGGLGLAPGANVGAAAAMFEPVHGSAPDIAGQDKANPTAAILSTVMLLRHLGEEAAAERIERAVVTVLRDGLAVTADLPRRPNGRTAGTTEFTELIIDAL